MTSGWQWQGVPKRCPVYQYLCAGTGALSFLVNSLASVQSAPPIEKCSAKPTAFGVATNPSCIHSGGSLVRWIDPTRLHSRYEDANVGFRFTNRTSTVEPSGPELKAG